MDPDEGWLSANVIPGIHKLIESPDCAIGKLLIGNSVRIPVLSLESRPVRHRVEQRPKRCITTSIVVRVKHLRIDLHRDHLKETKFFGVIVLLKVPGSYS